MALTRKMLREMGITDENAEEIIKAHAETVEALKGYRAENERLAGLVGELDNAKNSLAEYQTKFEALDMEKSMQAKRQAVTEMLRELHIPEGCVNSILHVTDFEKLEISEDGRLLDEDAVRSGLSDLYSGFIPRRYLYGAETASPPANSSDKGYSREDIRRMSSHEINENYQAIKQSLGVTTD
ncbi:MAG: hypothetical protein LUH23_02055 [Oscillospiraceae bacterium]|nr:hypothetical protein [Oscillospiraceae bacterium]